MIEPQGIRLRRSPSPVSRPGGSSLQAADAAVELLHRAAELLRPFVGLEATGAFLETIEGRPLDSVDDFNRLRLELQIRAWARTPRTSIS